MGENEWAWVHCLIISTVIPLFNRGFILDFKWSGIMALNGFILGAI